jgi:type VI protein secretion system component Hcp
LYFVPSSNGKRINETSKTLRQLETKHKNAVGKPVEFFQRKLKEITVSRSVMESSAAGEHAKATDLRSMQVPFR